MRDLAYNKFNGEGISQVLKPLKLKFLAKIHVPLRKVFAKTVTYVIASWLDSHKEHVQPKAWSLLCDT